MAKRLEAFPEDLRVRTTESYPWDEWFDGSAWELRKGEDYVIKTKSFVSNAQAKARKRGGSCRTGLLPNDEGVVIQYRAKLAAVPPIQAVPPMGEQPTSEKPPAPLVRLWAKHNGWPDLAERGNLPGEIVQAYIAAHSGSQT